MNLRELLTTTSERHGADRVALRFEGESITYGALTSRVERTAAALLEHGVTPGDRVLLLARNSPGWLVSFLATVGVGAVAVPVNPELTAEEVGYIASHCEPTVVLADADLTGVLPESLSAPVLAPGAEGPASTAVTWVECDDQDPALIFYTSGTTGRPKGVVLSHGNVAASAAGTRAAFRLGPDDSTLVTGPLAFIYGLALNVLAALGAGAQIHLASRFHPAETLRAIHELRSTVFMGVPTMFVMMLSWADQHREERAALDLASLRLFVSAGAPLPWSLATAVAEEFGPGVLDLWGLTEATPITTFYPEVDPNGRPGSCGRVLPGSEIRILTADGQQAPTGEIGEVVVRSPTLMQGYFRNPEATAEAVVDGWLVTGDLGAVDAEGYLSIVGRRKDLIIRGGANIYPPEVEDVVLRHPEVADCAVVGRDDPTFGEIVCAFVVPRAGSAVTGDDIRAFAGRSLAPYKVPAEVRLVTELPKGPTGKILKRALRQSLEEQPATAV